MLPYFNLKLASKCFVYLFLLRQTDGSSWRVLTHSLENCVHDKNRILLSASLAHFWLFLPLKQC